MQAAGADPEVAGDVAQLDADGHGLRQVACILAGRGAVGIRAVGARIAHGRLLLWWAWGEGIMTHVTLKYYLAAVQRDP